jgi:hypothetical protein
MTTASAGTGSTAATVALSVRSESPPRREPTASGRGSSRPHGIVVGTSGHPPIPARRRTAATVTSGPWTGRVCCAAATEPERPQNRPLETCSVTVGNAAGLLPALDEMCRAYRDRLGIAVEADLEPIELDPAAEPAVLRVLQEALANAVKHARPSRVVLRARDAGGGRAVLSVSTDSPRHPQQRTSAPWPDCPATPQPAAYTSRQRSNQRVKYLRALTRAGLL